jgi:hypothetical protein
MTDAGRSLDDNHWAGLRGGYRIPYDPCRALAALARGEGAVAAWDELWQNLHHQGDIGEASFAAIPHLVRMQAGSNVPDWNVYALAGTVELARDRPGNPSLPSELQGSYDSAWAQLMEIGLRDLGRARESTDVRCILGVLASKGERSLGQCAIDLTEDERRELLAGFG